MAVKMYDREELRQDILKRLAAGETKFKMILPDGAGDVATSSMQSFVVVQELLGIFVPTEPDEAGDWGIFTFFEKITFNPETSTINVWAPKDAHIYASRILAHYAENDEASGTCSHA